MTNDDVIVTEFAKFFENVCSVKNSDFACNSKNTFVDNFTKYQAFSICEPQYVLDIEMVEDVVARAKTGKAAGLDGLMAEHLKFAHPILLSVLKKLFNLLIQTGFVPDAFGIGLIFPIPKSSNMGCGFSKITDFRGITISPMISKIFEHCLTLIFESNLSSSHYQFGFKKGKGCRDALFVINETVNFMTENLSTVNLCFVDLSKAFDNVNHYVLYTKLFKKKVPTCLIRILMNWYSKCFCCVKWGNSVSRMFQVSQGVRQGGVLSPILFCIYVDDALSKLNDTDLGCCIRGFFINAIMYADDILLLSSSVNLLQNLVALCEREFLKINLKFNVSKSASLRIGARHKIVIPELTDLCGNPIRWVSEFKYLGVVVRHGIRFGINVHQNKVKFFRSFNALFAKLGSSNNPDTLLNLMRTNCLSILLYNVEAVHLTKTNVHDLCFPLNRSYVKIYHVQDKESISHCQFYTNQLPIEMLIDSKRLWYLLKLENSDCFLLSHIFEISTTEYIENLLNKYNIPLVNTRKLSKPALMKSIWNKFRVELNL